VFNILVIPALSALLSDGPLDTGRDVVYKEAQFYMLSVAALFLVLSLAVIYYPADGNGLEGIITRPLAVSLLCLYGLYVFIQYLDVSDADAESVSLSRRPLLVEWGVSHRRDRAHHRRRRGARLQRGRPRRGVRDALVPMGADGRRCGDEPAGCPDKRRGRTDRRAGSLARKRPRKQRL